MTDKALRSQFLDAMSRVAATVTIVTTDGPAGLHGMTVSAMVPVSADAPRPTLLVCLNQSCRAASPLIENGLFGVNVLSQGQAGIAGTFAGRGPAFGRERFGHGNWTRSGSGVPLLEDALAAFECKVLSHELISTHHVIVGEVTAIRAASQGRSLVYAERTFAVAGPL